LTASSVSSAKSLGFRVLTYLDRLLSVFSKDCATKVSRLARDFSFEKLEKVRIQLHAARSPGLVFDHAWFSVYGLGFRVWDSGFGVWGTAVRCQQSRACIRPLLVTGCDDFNV